MLFNETVVTNVRILRKKYNKWTKWKFFSVISWGINNYQWYLNFYRIWYSVCSFAHTK